MKFFKKIIKIFLKNPKKVVLNSLILMALSRIVYYGLKGISEIAKNNEVNIIPLLMEKLPLIISFIINPIGLIISFLVGLVIILLLLYFKILEI